MNELIYKLISSKYDVHIQYRSSTEFVSVSAFHHDTKIGQIAQATTLEGAFQALFDKLLIHDGNLTTEQK